MYDLYLGPAWMWKTVGVLAVIGLLSIVGSCAFGAYYLVTHYEVVSVDAEPRP